MNKQNEKRRSIWERFQPIAASLLLACAASGASASVTSPVIGQLLWSEEFNGSTLNTATWNTQNGNGCQINLCGYGNAELESYSPNNASIVDVPFEPGTRALAIRAQSQTVGSNVFTSARLDTQGKVQVQYGMIEIRMSAPNVATGLWPAAWMLGTSPQTWPRNGEIDIMEQGHTAAARAAAGSPTPSSNNFVGSNVITWQQSACVTGNASCAASTAWQTKNWYVPTTSLANRFVIYRLYWTESEMRFTVVDNGVEYNMYNNVLPVNSTELQSPFYLLLNMAVGGNFTDAASASQVTAPLPATMYVDYVRVYQLDGKGAVKLGNQVIPETGKFGVFTDTTAVNDNLVSGTTSDVFMWNSASMAAGNTAPYEGSNVIAWAYTAPGQWWGGGVQSRQTRDLSNFRNGTLKFRIKIPANVSFNIGVGDTYTNQNYVNFPANTTAYGLVRNGDWAQASIPVSTLLGAKVAAQSLMDVFMISSDANNLPGSTFQFAIDDIYYDSGTSGTTPPPTSLTSVSQTSATMLQFTANTGSWCDVHYTVNGGVQQNIRMTLNGTTNTYTAGGLKIGDVVNYSFTYWDTTHNYAVDTTQASYTMH